MTSTRWVGGGRRYSAEEIEAAVKGFRESGASTSAFAREIGVSWMTLRRWVERSSQEDAGDPRLIPVHIGTLSQPPLPWPEFVADCGLRLRVPPGLDSQRLAELLGVLRSC